MHLFYKLLNIVLEKSPQISVSKEIIQYLIGTTILNEVLLH